MSSDEDRQLVSPGVVMQRGPASDIEVIGSRGIVRYRLQLIREISGRAIRMLAAGSSGSECRSTLERRRLAFAIADVLGLALSSTESTTDPSQTTFRTTPINAVVAFLKDAYSSLVAA